MYKAEADIREGEKYDGYIAHTTNVAQQWIQYFADGGRLGCTRKRIYRRADYLEKGNRSIEEE